MKKKLDLIQDRPGSALLRFAVPMIIGNMFQQFYNMADSVIVGKFVGEDALAAVGASYSFTTVFIMIAIGGGIGASVLTSQYLGAGKFREMKTSVNTFLITFGVVSLLLAGLGLLVNPSILRALDTPANVFADAVLYLQIYFLGLPFMFMYNILSADFNALGKSKIPLALLIFSSLLNIVLDLVMVTTFQMGVAGVAIATVIAQGISSVVSFVVLMRVLKPYAAEGKARLFDPAMFVKGTKIAIPSIIQQSIVSIGMLLTQSAVNQFGSSALAGYSAGTRLESLCIVPMIATGNAMSTFTAQNLGAKKEERVREGYRAAYLIVIAFGLLLIVISQLCYSPILSLFADQGESPVAFQTGTAYFRFCGWFFAFLGFKAITDGILRGAGDTKVYMAANLINLAIRVSVARLASPVFGIQVIWYAVPLGWFVNYMISYLWYRTGNWKRQRIVR
ncbi:MAG TPA: MATE family efflux transporter [Candidatus Egerieimonas intestinavium]|uniref:Probable multidrug resistance protein NorM n=1 Tax=Candidatus Egerieimonas intestinavium TaxID=2840777 RepID=A0A9D1EKC9_9FIRM|nr:MATE family efflux transporter [Candidatus Egerieimonas intestinavium]